MGTLEKTTLASGKPVPLDYSHAEIRQDGSGLQKDYVVLNAQERANGWVRPYREKYVHTGKGAHWNGPVLIKYGTTANGARQACGALTKMSRPIAETYAKDPTFYSGTYCVGCKAHWPLDEFTWDGTCEQVGS